MNIPERFLQYIKAQALFQSHDRLLLAVSGGMDSVVLCALCKQAGFDFMIAHCNFQLRGEESERDELFVRQLGAQYQTEVVVKRFDTQSYAEAHKVSIQVAARELRYAWFYEMVGVGNKFGQQAGNTQHSTFNSQHSGINDSSLPVPTLIVTAHHLDDNIETLLMNFFKGTGIAGLRGILPKHDQLVRPLLFAGKEGLRQYAVDNNLSWVEDSSNTSGKYSRNYFRQQVIPLVEQLYPKAMDNLADNIPRFREIELLYRQSIAEHIGKLVEQRGEDFYIPALKLKKSIPLHSIVYEIIKAYGFTTGQVDEVIRLLDSGSGRYIVSSTHRILKNRNWLILSPLQTAASPIILIEDAEEKVGFEKGSLQLTIIPAAGAVLATASSIAMLDADEIIFPLILRKWKTGDYFYPLGMTKKKKLNRFFIDHKIAQSDKEKIWVLEMNKKIVWVLGMRIDNRFRVTSSTKEILKAEMRVT